VIVAPEASDPLAGLKILFCRRCTLRARRRKRTQSLACPRRAPAAKRAATPPAATNAPAHQQFPAAPELAPASPNLRTQTYRPISRFFPEAFLEADRLRSTET